MSEIDDWCDPSYAGTLTRVKTIEMCVESAFATVCVQSAIAGCFLLFWWGRLGRVTLHQVTWSKNLNNKLKVVISPLSETKSESKSFTIPFYGNPLNSARDFIRTAATAAVVTKNVRMSRRWRAESVVYRICKQPSSRFVHILPKTWLFTGLPSLSRKFSAPHPDFKFPYLSNRASE
jgi:hypothetical protein